MKYGEAIAQLMESTYIDKNMLLSKLPIEPHLFEALLNDSRAPEEYEVHMISQALMIAPNSHKYGQLINLAAQRMAEEPLPDNVLSILPRLSFENHMQFGFIRMLADKIRMKQSEEIKKAPEDQTPPTLDPDPVIV